MDNDQIFHSLMNCFSERTMEYFLNLGLDSQQEKDPELIIERLSSLVSSGNNHNIHRQEFQMRIQNPDETFDSWMAALKELADQAHFDLDCCGKCKDARLLQQVIYGLAKLETRNMLMNIRTGLTLEQATRVIKTTECDQNNNDLTVNVQNNLHYSNRNSTALFHLFLFPAIFFFIWWKINYITFLFGCNIKLKSAITGQSLLQRCMAS